jgi:hypothetical protein
MWNGNQQQSQYAPQISTRLDFTNQIQQRLPPRQSSPSPQYSQSINNNNNAYSSNSTVNTNNCKTWIFSDKTYFIFVF